MNGKYIVDYFSYYDETCKELLKLRIKLLDPYVDHFVICESNRTHSGIPIEYKLRERIKEYGLPVDKITIIDLDIPDNDLLFPEEIDYHNSAVNSTNINSVKARTRERLQRDAILYTLNQFPNDAFFIVGDCDEIINPVNIDWITNVVAQTKNAIIKIPLVYLEGKANLRVCDSNTAQPKPWDLSLFICQKRHLIITRPINIRCNYKNPYPIVFCTQDNQVIQDLGWHFSWMGGSKTRIIKRDSFCHYEDNLPYLKTKSYNNLVAINMIASDMRVGSIPPSLEQGSILLAYDKSLLPDIIFSDDEIYNYLFKED